LLYNSDSIPLNSFSFLYYCWVGLRKVVSGLVQGWLEALSLSLPILLLPSLSGGCLGRRRTAPQEAAANRRVCSALRRRVVSCNSAADCRVLHSARRAALSGLGAGTVQPPFLRRSCRSGKIGRRFFISKLDCFLEIELVFL
jgi:hypothetical protein